MQKLIISSLVLLFLLFGCKSSKFLLPSGEVLTKDKLIENHTINRISSSSILFKKCSFSFSDGKTDQNLTGSIFLIKDSVVYISLQALLGIEVARISISPKEVIVLNRLQKQSIFVDYQKFISRYSSSLSFYTFQSVLLNSLFCVNPTFSSCFDSYTLVSVNDTYSLNNREKDMFRWFQAASVSDNFSEFIFSPNGFLLSSSLTSNNLASSFLTQYSDFKLIEGSYYPLTLSMKFNTDNASFALNVIYGNIIFNPDQGISFSIPSSYEKIYK